MDGNAALLCGVGQSARYLRHPENTSLAVAGVAAAEQRATGVPDPDDTIYIGDSSQRRRIRLPTVWNGRSRSAGAADDTASATYVRSGCVLHKLRTACPHRCRVAPTTLQHGRRCSRRSFDRFGRTASGTERGKWFCSTIYRKAPGWRIACSASERHNARITSKGARSCIYASPPS
jgi:hypothetical protein